MTHDEWLEKILTVVRDMVDADPEHLRLAKNEADENSEPDPETAMFLKLNEKRLGRDLELYRFMAKVSISMATANFLEEVVLQLKQPSPVAFQIGIVELRTFDVFGALQSEWRSVIDSFNQ